MQTECPELAPFFCQRHFNQGNALWLTGLTIALTVCLVVDTQAVYAQQTEGINTMKWLGGRIVVDGEHVVEVDLSDNRLVRNEDLEGLQEFKQLRRLNISDSHLDDRCMTHLASLANLRTLNLSKTKISNGGLGSFDGSGPTKAT